MGIVSLDPSCATITAMMKNAGDLPDVSNFPLPSNRRMKMSQKIRARRARFGVVRAVKPHSAKYSDFQKSQISPYVRHPIPTEGRWPTSSTWGGLRWTRRVLLTRVPEADGKNVWSRCTDAGFKPVERSTGDGGKSDRRGEHAISRKTLRRECRVIPV